MKKYEVWEHERVTNWDGTHDSDDYLCGTFKTREEAEKYIKKEKRPNMDPYEFGLGGGIESDYRIVEIEA